jgi:hypothetical protein
MGDGHQDNAQGRLWFHRKEKPRPESAGQGLVIVKGLSGPSRRAELARIWLLNSEGPRGPLIYPTKARTTATQKKTPIPTKQSAAIRSLQLACLRRPVSAVAVSFLRLGIRVSAKTLLMMIPHESPTAPAVNCYV